MTTGVIRKDLFYRLSVININIPPIRERRDDIELLCQFFINKYNYKLNKKIKGISKDVLNRFLEYSWPGNVRELENFMEGAMNMVPEGEFILRDEDFVSTSYISSANSYSHVLKNMIQESSLPKLMNTIENELIDYAMKKNGNNITNAANYLGISRQNLQHKIKRKN